MYNNKETVSNIPSHLVLEFTLVQRYTALKRCLMISGENLREAA